MKFKFSRVMKNSIALVVLFVLALSFFPFQKAGALTLSPTLLELGVEPGGEINSKIKVFNESSGTVSLYPSAVNFTSQDEIGTPYFLYEEKEGLAAWIEIIPGPIVLLPGERQDVIFTIKVPQGAESGGHYAGILFGSAPSDVSPETGQVTIVSKLGALLLVRVSGDVTFQSAIQEFHILNDKTFFTRLPVDFWYRLRNGGNLHIRPQGEIAIKNIFGLTVTRKPKEDMDAAERRKYQYRFVDANPVDGAVLPESIRRFEAAWKKSEPYDIEYRNFFQNFFSQAIAEYKNFAFGRYTAFLKLPNVPESLSMQGISFWVFPWHFLIVFIVILTISIWLVVLIVSRYNRWIINRARAKFEKEKTSNDE